MKTWTVSRYKNRTRTDGNTVTMTEYAPGHDTELLGQVEAETKGAAIAAALDVADWRGKLNAQNMLIRENVAP